MNKDLILEKGDIVHCKRRCARGKIIVANDFNGKNINEFEKAYEYQVMKVSRPVKYKTIYEFKEILNAKEKKYLSYVVRPFRNRVDFITKQKIYNCEGEHEYIYIRIHNDALINMPNFKIGTMYKGMETGKEYTLEELGL